MSRVSWWDIYVCEDANTASELFTEKVNSILDKHAPVKKIQVRSQFAPWLSEETKACIAARDQAYKTALSDRSDKSWSEYKIIRNKVNRQVKQEKIYASLN